MSWPGAAPCGSMRASAPRTRGGSGSGSNRPRNRSRRRSAARPAPPWTCPDAPRPAGNGSTPPWGPRASRGRSSPPAPRVGDAAGATVAVPGRAKAGWQRFHATLGALRLPQAIQQPGAVIAEIVSRSYRTHVETHFDDARDRLEDLAQLAAFAETYQSVDILLTDVSLREGFKGETITAWRPPDEHLVLSTMHQAKGLEWKAVFLLGLSDGQFPHPKSLEDPTALEEERRLFYVAVTRAKDELYLTYPMTRYTSQTGEVLLRPSLFLQELPDTLTDHWSVQTVDPVYDD